MSIRVARISPTDATHLLDAHHALMRSLFDVDANHYLELGALMAEHIRFFGALDGEDVIGCGALAILPHYGEIKSMYVDEAHRGKGVADSIVRRLLTEARRHDLSLVRLETGDKLEAAHRLYVRHGFSLRGPYGDYPDLPVSVFMEKRLY